MNRKGAFEKQLETEEIRYATGETDRSIYQKAATDIHNQLHELKKEIEKTEMEFHSAPCKPVRTQAKANKLNCDWKQLYWNDVILQWELDAWFT